jgi:hypothetical protein
MASTASAKSTEAAEPDHTRFPPRTGRKPHRRVATGVRNGLHLTAAVFEQREHELRLAMPPKPPPTVIKSPWMQRLAELEHPR